MVIHEMVLKLTASSLPMNAQGIHYLGALITLTLVVVLRNALMDAPLPIDMGRLQPTGRSSRPVSNDGVRGPHGYQ